MRRKSYWNDRRKLGLTVGGWKRAIREGKEFLQLMKDEFQGVAP